MNPKIKKAEIVSKNNYCGLRFWELACEREDGYFNNFNLKVSTIEEMNIASNLNSTKKVTVFLNSPEGIEWINNKKEHCSYTSIGCFL